ncbi:hypothetical protein MMC08_004903 [Hypocenomyce scalaris]|nr:hypothetical protein [Hypocenomyce scalaris]
MISSMPGQAAVSLLNEAYEVVSYHLEMIGDGVLAGGMFTWIDQGLSLQVVNANNHQTTWAVLGEALVALQDFMNVNNDFGAVKFTIFDGGNEVGTGSLA